MTLNKGDRLRTTFDGKHYEVAGYWEGSIVFSPLDLNQEQCIIYTPSEVKELLATGEFMRVGC